MKSTFAEDIEKLQFLDDSKLTELQNNVLYFVTGSLAKKFLCEFCEEYVLTNVTNILQFLIFIFQEIF